MSTVAEIEAALPELTEADLQRVELALRRLRERSSSDSCDPRLAALKELQARLDLSEQQVSDWQATAREARR